MLLSSFRNFPKNNLPCVAYSKECLVFDHILAEKFIEMIMIVKNRVFQLFCFVQVLKESAILGAVEGGYSIEGREDSAKYLANSSVFGYVIDGLHSNGPDVEQLTFENVKPVLEASLVIAMKVVGIGSSELKISIFIPYSEH